LLNDGSMVVLSHHYDLFGLFQLNKKFKIESYKEIKLNNALNGFVDGKYLFNEKYNDNNACVFFYSDYEYSDTESNNRSYNLYMNVASNGDLKQEVIPMSPQKDIMSLPYPAKDGYVLIREFNKTENLNQIKLTKLNF
ncbi:MAG: hypothetical protein ACRCVT_16210, partial [Leadbetterella sp.]